MKFSWQWNWKLLVFALIFFPLTLKLGFWQLSRADEKQQLLSSHHQRMSANPVEIAEEEEDQQYRRVKVTGEYDDQTTLLLDNRVRRGKPGYEVISIFRPLNGVALLVNRGWVEANLDRGQLPRITPVPGQVGLTGYLYRSPGKQIMLGDDIWQADKSLQIVQNAAPDRASEQLGETFYPFQLRLDETAPGALQTGWHIVNVMPGKHTGYAVQWFALAALLLVLTVLTNTNLPAIWRHRRERGDSND